MQMSCVCQRQELICWNVSFSATFLCGLFSGSLITLLRRDSCCHLGIFFFGLHGPEISFDGSSDVILVCPSGTLCSMLLQKCWPSMNEVRKGTQRIPSVDKEILQASHSWPAGVSLETKRRALIDRCCQKCDRRSNICHSDLCVSDGGQIWWNQPTVDFQRNVYGNKRWCYLYFMPLCVLRSHRLLTTGVVMTVSYFIMETNYCMLEGVIIFYYPAASAAN